MKSAIFIATLLAVGSPIAAIADALPIKHYTTTDTTIGELLADPAAKAVIEHHFPGLPESPSITMANGMTMHQLQQYKPDMFSDKALAETDFDLAKIPAK